VSISAINEINEIKGSVIKHNKQLDIEKKFLEMDRYLRERIYHKLAEEEKWMRDRLMEVYIQSVEDEKRIIDRIMHAKRTKKYETYQLSFLVILFLLVAAILSFHFGY
jgi:hypothetical protein